jgi:hypothetical protein
MQSKRREVHLSLDRGFDFGDYQMNYLNYRDWRIIPSTDIIVDGMVHYSSNRLGCQGPEIRDDAPVLGVFGDSVIHGCAGDSFVHRIDLPPLEKLNCGVEGMVLPFIIDRVFEVAVETPLAVAAVHGGWHNLLYNERGEAFWTQQLDRLDALDQVRIAHFRLVCDINEASVAAGYAEVMERTPDYFLWDAMDFTSVEGRRAGMTAIADYNRFIEAYCERKGRVLIDLEPVLRPKALDDLGRNFIDFIHPSPSAYDAMARQVEATLAPIVGDKAALKLA